MKPRQRCDRDAGARETVLAASRKASRLSRGSVRILIYSLANSFPSPAGDGKESAIPLVKLRPLGNFSLTVAGLVHFIITIHRSVLMHYRTNLLWVKFSA